MTGNWIAFLLWAAIVLLIVIPSRIDPAVQIRKYLDERDGKR